MKKICLRYIYMNAFLNKYFPQKIFEKYEEIKKSLN